MCKTYQSPTRIRETRGRRKRKRKRKRKRTEDREEEEEEEEKEEEERGKDEGKMGKQKRSDMKRKEKAKRSEQHTVTRHKRERKRKAPSGTMKEGKKGGRAAHILQLHVLQVLLCGSAQHFDHLIEEILLPVRLEQGLPVQELGKDAARGPHVDCVRFYPFFAGRKEEGGRGEVVKKKKRGQNGRHE